MKLYLKKNFFFVLFIIAFLHVTDFFYNCFSILNRGYEERMIRSYGHCEREGYGFVKQSYEKINDGNLKVVNFESQLWPTINNIFFDLRKKTNPKYIIFLNVNDSDINSEDNSIKYRNKIYKLNSKTIIYKDSNCYLVKND
tara:strand:+ start:468 stop:890 length:423 start_codon:yes stop_codon:yes gene_type:complete